MKYLIFFLIVLPFNLKGIDDSYFPQIKGCFCEGGLIYGKAKKKDRIIVNYKTSRNMILFNQLFKKYLVSKYNFYEIILIRAFEVSQFIRMIPFKVAINEKKAILFYGLACKLIKDLKNDYKKKIKF